MISIFNYPKIKFLQFCGNSCYMYSGLRTSWIEFKYTDYKWEKQDNSIVREMLWAGKHCEIVIYF